MDSPPPNVAVGELVGLLHEPPGTPGHARTELNSVWTPTPWRAGC